MIEEKDALSLQEIYQKMNPSVVSIVSTLRSGTATGTGIIMSENGYIITTHHVIEGAYQLAVLTYDDTQYTAELIGSDAISDLAVLKIEAEGLTAAEFGDSDALRVGDSVVAIGDPLGIQLRGTMTNGIISAINRDLTVEDRKMTLIQTNAALNNGNSGGPLINCYGQVIGINTMKMSSYYSSASVEGLGFAIPVSVAKPIIDELIENGYVHAILAGNALATHDLEGAYLHTALGQDIYTQKSVPNGHYHHLDTINRVRYHGSIRAFIENEHIDNGIIYSCEKCGVPYVLGGSIRDDGPLPPVYGDVYAAQDAMRDQIRSATTVISMATMLHTIATGNMTPSFRVLPDGTVRQVYFYCVDVSEFVVNKLADRGSLSARGIVTNVQDFVVNLQKGLGL